MKGIIFLDDNYRPVELPMWFYTPHYPKWQEHKKEFKDFIHKIYYIFFDIPERMKWFQNTYFEYDEMNSIFEKHECGCYSYDEDGDYWYKETDRDIIFNVSQAYIENTKQPLSDCEDYNNGNTDLS